LDSKVFISTANKNKNFQISDNIKRKPGKKLERKNEPIPTTLPYVFYALVLFCKINLTAVE
jgi:hypothetical protein